mgnify:CR=1 FL=1|tara:strand:- start:949 stop:1209 length:261 start_codon:yes stop_codon:yes gene_type:complete
MEKKIIFWKFNKKNINLIKNLIENFMKNYDSSVLIILEWIIYNDKEGFMIINSKINNNDLNDLLLKHFDSIKIYNYEKINDWLNYI